MVFRFAEQERKKEIDKYLNPEVSTLHIDIRESSTRSYIYAYVYVKFSYMCAGSNKP